MSLCCTTYIDPEDHRARIADAAYYRYAMRGYEHGHDLEDWLWAEKEVEAELLAGCVVPFESKKFDAHAPHSQRMHGDFAAFK